METEDSIMFRRKDLPYASFAAFEDMRQKHELCDLTLKVQNYTFTAHRVILAAGIPYFRAIFTNRSFETEQKEIAVGNMDPTALESLIHYAYTSEVKISRENAQALLLASETLQIYEVKSACFEFLCERLRVDNVVSVRTFALTVNNSKVVKNCDKYIEDNFEEFCRSDDFLGLPCSDILKIVTKDDLNVSSEEIVYEAVMNWVKFSVLERQDTLHSLLSAIRMPCLPVNYLVKKVSTEKLIRASISCMELVQDIQSYHLLTNNVREFPLANVLPRTKSCMANGMYAVSFASDKWECLVSSWDFVKEVWNTLSSVEMERDLIIHSVVCVNNCLYIFLLDGTVRMFHTRSLQWRVMQAEHLCILGTAILPFWNVIYFFGSMDMLFESKVYCFDTDKTTWLGERNMKTPRHSSAAVSLDSFIFVMGGSRIYPRCDTDIVEKYDPVTDCWYQMSSMLSVRQGHGSAVISKKIYVCGGSINDETTGTAEVYDSVTNEWSHISPMSTRRYHISLVPYCGKLCALGGENVVGDTCSVVEVYETEGDRWAPGFPAPEGFWACCINVCS